MKKKDTAVGRFRAAGYIYTAILFLLLTRLFYIQIIKGKHYSDMALPQQTISIPIEEKRGHILDRNGIPFTKAGEIFELLIFPKMAAYDEEAFEVIRELTGKGEDYFTAEDKAYYMEKVINPDPDLISKVQNGLYSGVILNRTEIRYDEKSLARHVVGYLRKSDGVPMSGIEKAYEQFLHAGSARMVQATADAKDSIISGLGYVIKDPDIQWYNVQLTLDYNIQSILEEALDKYPGRYHGGIIVDASNGNILAAASRPQFNQADPSAGMDEGGNVSFLSIPFQQYPIGSVFKIVVAAAALESGKYDENTVFECTGGIQAGGKFFPCHVSTGGLGTITLREAFAHSCNDTFIRIAMDIGGDYIVETAAKFGFGSPVDIELSNSAGILMPKTSYTGSGAANLAIGQGETMVTPLQAADMITTILNHGERIQLSLVSGLSTPEGKLLEKNNANKLGRVISRRTADTLIRWMNDVTEYGTGTAAYDPEIGGTGGKTGTPQVSGDPHSNEYGWFAGFFPVVNPQYVIVIMSREPGGAGLTAVPVFHHIARAIWSYDNGKAGY